VLAVVVVVVDANRG